jgi:hypothetical protein
MALPLLIMRKTREVRHVDARCPKCSSDSGFEVDRDMHYLWLLFLPMGAGQGGVDARCTACTQPLPAGVTLDLPKPNVLLRFGWLFFLVIPLLDTSLKAAGSGTSTQCENVKNVTGDASPPSAR